MGTLAANEDELVELLLKGDEGAFNALVDRYHTQMLRVARQYCNRPGAVEEIVQDTWIAILKALPRFERRSSLRSWMFRILSNRAKTRAIREKRVMPAASLRSAELDPVDDLERFAADGHWSSPPDPWKHTPESLALDEEAGNRALAAIQTLPENQRLVITYRDVQGWSSEEVCQVMEISRANQRVLLHRARTRVRDALAEYLAA